MMEEYNEEYWSEPIDLSKYIKRLTGHWKTIVLFAAVAFLIGCVYALCSPRKYTVTAKLAPELSNTATTRLSSLASLVGLSATNLGTTDAVYPMVYPELLKSNVFIADLFESPVTLSKKGDTSTVTLYKYLTRKKKKTDNDGEAGPVDPFHFTKEQDKVAEALSKRIQASIDKKTLVVSITVTMDDALVCAELSRAVIENLKLYVTLYRTEKALNDCDYYEKMYADARDDYYSALKEYSNYTDSHQGVTLKSYTIESERLKNESSLKYQLYNSTAQQLQAAKAKVQQETPVFAELIHPAVPHKSSNSRKKTALAFGFMGVFVGCVFVLWRYRKDECKASKGAATL